jgi:methionine-rich copper-binding protein CopC
MKAVVLAFVLAHAALAAGPQLVSSTPAQGQDSVLPGTTITLVFSTPMDGNTLTANNAFTLYNFTGGYQYSNLFPTLSTDGLTATISAYSSSLGAGAAYRLDLNSTVIKDRAGNPLVPTPPIFFNTFLHPNKTAPGIIGSVPGNGEAGVATNTLLYVVFDEPIAKLNYDSGIVLSAPAGPIQFTSSVVADRVLQIKSPLLFPANQQISVSVNGIYDRNGNSIAAPLTFAFQTGILPDVTQQSVALMPPPNTPVTLPLHITFSKPLDPPLVAVSSVKFQSYFQYLAGDTYPATFVLSADRRTLTINAGTVLQPGDYQLQVSIPFDRTQGNLNGFGGPVTLDTPADPAPAQLLAASPPDGSTDVPITTQIRLIFTKAVDLAATGSAISLTMIAGPVPGNISIDNSGTMATFKPQTPLQPSTTYTFSCNGLSDFAGNTVAPFSTTFTIRSSGTYSGSFTVVSASPADQVQGVDPMSPIQITFSHPVDAVSLYGINPGITIIDSNGAVPGSYTVNGVVVTFQPSTPMADGYVSVTAFNVQDLGETNVVLYRESFVVSNPQPDTTRPTVIAVSPSAGSTVLYNAGHVELAFSRPMSPTTLTSHSSGPANSQGNFSVYVNGNTPVPLIVAVQSSTRVALEFNAPPGVTITLIASDAITDYVGNSLVPFRATFQTSAKPANSAAASLVRQYPYNQSIVTPTGSGVIAITTIWSAPLDPDSVQQNLLVYTPSAPVAGSLRWTDDFRAFTFVPATPFADGTTVAVALLPPAHDAAGLPISWSTSFNSGYHPTPTNPGALAVTGSNFPAYGAAPPLNFQIELQFNQDLSDTVLATVKATFGKSQTSVQNCPFVRVSPRVLLFTPPFPLAANTYYFFNFSAGALTWNASFTTSSEFASQNPTVTIVGPVGSNVPQNTGLGVLFSEPVSSLALGGGITLTAGGVDVLLNYNWTGPQSISLQPTSFLQPNTTYTVTVSGFENAAVKSVVTRTWTFQTGSGVDVTPPTLLRTQPSGSGISQDAVVSFSFDKPINPAANNGNFNLANVTGNFPTNITPTLGFSDDLRTAYLRPNPVLAAGATYQASANMVQDFAGNSMINPPGRPPSATFQVGYSAPAPAAVTGCSPPANATGVPLNAVIQVRASANLLLVNDLSATLVENGNPLDSTLQYSGDALTLTIVPARPLAANTQIDVTVNGVGGAPYTFTFFTGTAPDQVAPTATWFPPTLLYPVPASVVPHIRFNKPLNPLSVNPNSVTLQSSNTAYLEIGVSLDNSGQLISITPKRPLPVGITYIVKWSVSDWAGNSVSGGTTFTVGPKDDAPATLLGIDPADGSTGVSSTPIIQATFSQPVELTLGDGSIALLLNGTPVSGKVAVQNTAISFVPSHPLQPGATYTVQLRGVVDAFGAVVPDASATFTMALPNDTLTPLKLVSTLPVNNSVGVPADAPVRLTFNHPVTLASALTLINSSAYAYTGDPYTSVQVQGNDVVLEPGVPVSGPTVRIIGRVRDNAGYPADVNLYFTIAPSQDTTPPVLEYAFPPAGSTIPTTGANLYLRFSKPVQVGQNAIRVIGGTVGDWYAAEDGRTLAANQINFTPDTDITIALTTGITDYAGNPLAPLSYQLHSLSAGQSKAPAVGSITPSTGALNVPVDSTIQLQFTHSMDPISVNTGLHITADGNVVTGAWPLRPTT